MYERILVPLDGSEVGEAALPHVKKLISRLAPEVKVEVTLLQVVSDLTHYVVAGEASAAVPYTDKEIEQIKNKVMKYLQKAAEGLKSTGMIVKTIVEVGSAAEGITKTADKISADLIAMSTHGRSGITRWAFGSVTDRVLREGNRPVLTVRTPRDKE